MKDQVFSDGIGQIVIIGGTVRLDFITYSPVEKDSKGQPVAVLSQRVVMSLDGFMQATGKVKEAALAVSNLVQRAREGQPADPAPAAATGSPTLPEAASVKRPFP